MKFTLQKAGDGMRGIETAKRGFTFLETLIVIGIIAVVGILAVPVYQGFHVREQLDSSATEILEALRLAEVKAMAGEGNAAAGVHLAADRFVMFAGDSFVGAPENFVVELPSNVRITGWSLAGGGDDVVFTQLTGGTLQNGTITMSASSLSESVTVSVSPIGLVEVQ